MVVQPILKQSKDQKVVFRLKQLVGIDCEVRIRSSPETLIAGVLDSFDLEVSPSIIVIDCDRRGLYIINFQDISFIKEIKP